MPPYYENVSRLMSSNNTNNGNNQHRQEMLGVVGSGGDQDINNLYANIDDLPLPPPPVMIAGDDNRYYGRYIHTDQTDFPPPPPPPNSMEPTSYMNNVGRILSSYQPQQPTSLGNVSKDTSHHIYANTMSVSGGGDSNNHLNVNNNIYYNHKNAVEVSYNRDNFFQNC